MLSFRTLFTSVCFALLSFPIIAWAWFDYINGGDGWRQGDWLINFGDGQIRRGLFGEFLIFVSDTTGINLLATTQIVQVFFFAAAVFVLWQIALRYSRPSVVLLVGLAPASFLTFLAANPMGSQRKEVFAVLALSLLVLSSLTTKRSMMLPVLALVVYVLGCIGNALHCLMLPVFLLGFYFLQQQGRLTKTAFITLSTIVTVMAAFWMGYAIVFNAVSDLSAICAPLLERGLDPKVCNDAIRWLVTGEVDHSAQVLQRLTLGGLLEYAVVAVLCLVPLWVAMGLFAEKRILLLMAIICFVPLLPLYVSATDWGRWLSLSYTSMVLLMLLGHTAKQLTMVQLPSRTVVAVLVSVSLLMAPEHSLGWKPGGAVMEVIQNILIFL